MVQMILSSPVVAALVVGLFGLLSIWVGLGRFRSERWWERKAAAYASVIEGLQGIYEHAAKYVDSIENGYELSEGWAKHLDEARLKGQAELTKGAGIGSFLMTERAAAILSNTLEQLEKISVEGDYLSFHEQRAEVVKGAIQKMKAEAKSDLRT